jgi:hypothetical protein
MNRMAMHAQLDPAVEPAELAPGAAQARTILRIGFTVAPVVAGLDKFAGLLTDWTQYLWPVVPQLLGVSAAGFMVFVGVVEVAAGVFVGVRPRLGGYVVFAWLSGIVINLLLLGSFLDVALRDVGLALGALALARLATASTPPASRVPSSR